jgi:hypothetical protein
MIPDHRVIETAEPTGDYLTREARLAIWNELDAICSDPQFSTSQRNCAFLRYVVSETLSGRATYIKERTIGKELFGRPIDYDTGSDAVVRVRATEVRKRLGSYYEEHQISQTGWRIRLPLRTYIPVFVPENNWEAAGKAFPGESQVVSQQGSDFILPLSRMMIPTIVALFLCAATFRWQVFSGTPFLDFWETLLAGKAGVSLILDQDPADPRTVTMDDLKIVEPILEETALLHAKSQVKSSSTSVSDPAFVPIHITHRSHWNNDSSDAFVTVIPGANRELWIESANPASLRSAIHVISDSDLFLQDLQVAIRRKNPSSFRLSASENLQAQEISPPGSSRQQAPR